MQIYIHVHTAEEQLVDLLEARSAVGLELTQKILRGMITTHQLT